MFWSQIQQIRLIFTQLDFVGHSSESQIPAGENVLILMKRFRGSCVMCLCPGTIPCRSIVLVHIPDFLN